MGRLEEVTAAYDSAETHTKQALSFVSNYDASDIAYQYFWQLGRIQNKQGNTPNAIAAYTKAYDALQSLRRDIATINPEVQFSFRDRPRQFLSLAIWLGCLICLVQTTA